MRKIHYPFIGVIAMFFITSSTLKPQESKRLFEKTVFIELTYEEDSTLFQPFSKAWSGYWNRSADIYVSGTSLMNYDKYKLSFDERADNLWTILHPMIIHGTIQSYFPYDPETFGLGNWDDGELRYPVKGQDENETFLTSESVRENLCFLLGQFGPMSDIPMVDEYGDYKTKSLADGTESYVYPSPDYNWYSDKDIVKFKLRVSVLVNKKGKEKKRVITSICPITYQISETGQIEREKELLWLNFEELEPHLKEAYYFDEKSKPVSYLDHIRKKLKNADLSEKQ